MAPESRQNAKLADAVQQVTEKAQILVREEVELARTELTEKLTKLGRGAVIAAAAGLFIVVGLLFLLNALAWLTWKLVSDAGDTQFIGFLIVAILLFIVAAIAGYVASRLFKKGSPPTPQMAIDEAQLIRRTVTTAQAPTRTLHPGRGLAEPATTTTTAPITTTAPATTTATAPASQPGGGAPR